MTTLQSTLKQLPEHGSCFICGLANLHNPGLRWYVEEKGVVSSEFNLRLHSGQILTLTQQGPPGGVEQRFVGII